MKKVIYFFVVLMFLGAVFSCTVDNGIDNPSAPGAQKFSPPSWIIGAWSDEFSINNYTFTSNNVTFSTEGYSVDFGAVYKEIPVNETSNSTQYIIDMPSVEAKYAFVKLSDTSLNYSITASGLTVGPLVLYK